MTNPTVDPTPAATRAAELPEWARTELTSVRAEAAQRRVDLRAKEAEHTEAARLLAEVTAAKTAVETDLATVRGDLMRLRVALAAGVPAEKATAFAARLVGTTEAELIADAKTAVALFATPAGPDPAVDPSQGRGHDAPIALSPKDAFANAIRETVEALKR